MDTIALPDYTESTTENAGLQELSETDQVRLMEQFVSALNRFDVETMVSQLHPEVIMQRIAEGRVVKAVEGIAAFRSFIEEEKGLYSSHKRTVLEYCRHGDQLHMEISYTAVFAAGHGENQNQGDSATGKGVSEAIFCEGKIKRLTDIFFVSG